MSQSAPGNDPKFGVQSPSSSNLPVLPAYSTWPQDPSPPSLAGRVKAGPSAGETDEYQRVPSAGTTDEDDQSRVRSPALSSGMLLLQQTITLFGDSRKWVQIPGWLLQIKNPKFWGAMAI